MEASDGQVVRATVILAADDDVRVSTLPTSEEPERAWVDVVAAADKQLHLRLQGSPLAYALTPPPMLDPVTLQIERSAYPGPTEAEFGPGATGCELAARKLVHAHFGDEFAERARDLMSAPAHSKPVVKEVFGFRVEDRTGQKGPTMCTVEVGFVWLLPPQLAAR